MASLFDRFPRATSVCAVLLAGLNVGCAIRFWRALFGPRPDPRFTLDWTPAVYWGLGVILAVVSLRFSRSTLPRFTPPGRKLLISAALIVLIAYLTIPAIVVFRSFALLWS